MPRRGFEFLFLATKAFPHALNHIELLRDSHLLERECDVGHGKRIAPLFAPSSRAYVSQAKGSRSRGAGGGLCHPLALIAMLGGLQLFDGLGLFCGCGIHSQLGETATVPQYDVGGVRQSFNRRLALMSFELLPRQAFRYRQ